MREDIGPDVILNCNIDELKRVYECTDARSCNR
jgi:hypothetical protein